MKRSVLICLLCLCTFTALFTGCDAFRRLAGRPVSAEIEAKRAAIEAVEEAQHQARMDSLKKVEKQMADSLAVLDSLENHNEIMRSPKSLGGLYSEELAHRYYIIVGAFVDKGNAAALKLDAQKAGYEVALINFRNGYTAVGLCPSDSIVVAYDWLRKVKEEKFAPADAWILVNQN